MSMGKFILIDSIVLNSLLTISVVLMMVTSTASECPMSFDVGTDQEGQPTTAVVMFVEPINKTCTPGSGSSLSIGSHPVVCIGDGESCFFTIAVVDRSLPVFTSCPPTIQKYISYELSQSKLPTSIVVTWDKPIADDNTGKPTLTSTHEPGAEFSVGSTEVVYTATDSAGNIGSCTFTVQVTTTGSYQPPTDRIFVKNFYPLGNCLSVTWPESEDNATTGYSIYVYKEGENKNSLDRIIAPRGSSTYMYKELCNLQAGQLYVVEVKNLFNGKVLTASALHFTKPLPPRELRALVGATSLVLSWSRSQQNVDQYEVVTGTRVQYVSKTTDRVKVDSLRPGSSVQPLTVRSVVGTGNRRSLSDGSSATETDIADVREFELIAYDYTESTIRVAWKAISKSSDELNPYMLIIEPQDAVENFLKVLHNSDAQFKGLKPNTNYHIQLLSNLGFHLETTQKTRPGRVTSLRAVKVLEDFVTLTWDPPTEGDVDSYDVSISPGNRSEPTNMMGTSFEFSSLANETEYFITVVSVYNSMKSKPQTILVTTGVTKPVPADAQYFVLAVMCVLALLVVTQLIVIVIICRKCQGIKQKSLDSHVYDDTINVQRDDCEAYENTTIGPTH